MRTVTDAEAHDIEACASPFTTVYQPCDQQ
jgi:hypothetical protein